MGGAKGTRTPDPHTARTRQRARTGVLPATEHRRGRSAGRNCRQRCRQNCGQNCGQLGRSSTATNATCIRIRLDAGRIDRGRMASEGRTAGCWARGQRAYLTMLRLRTTRYARSTTQRHLPFDRFDQPETLQLMEFVEVVLGQIAGLDPFGTAVVDFP